MDGDGVHIRLMVTRGVRSTPYQDPRVVISPPTIVIIPSGRRRSRKRDAMLKLFTGPRAPRLPDVQDPKLNSHSKLNCITACIQAAEAGADEALMLDPHGFVATCNSTHFFIVREGECDVDGDYCLDGITRGLVLEVAREAGIPCDRAKFLADRRLRRRRGVHDRHLRRRCAVGTIDGRVIGTERGADGRAAPATLP
jgi:branched-chain amino acid aminotransferase